MKATQIRWKDINDNSTVNHCRYSTFKTFCSLMSSCDECDGRIRLLCKVKNQIENLQVRIIRHMLNKRPG